MAKPQAKDPVPFLEWLSAAIGLAIAVALLAIIGHEAIGGGDGSAVPVLAVRIDGIEATPGGHVVKVVVTNESSTTAARVQLEGTAGGETGTASIDYVPGHSQAEGGLLFRADPRGGDLTVRVTGYQLP